MTAVNSRHTGRVAAAGAVGTQPQQQSAAATHGPAFCLVRWYQQHANRGRMLQTPHCSGPSPGAAPARRWRLVSAPSIPGLLSLDPNSDPTSVLSNLTMGTEVEVRPPADVFIALGIRCQKHSGAAGLDRAGM
jgi:hypothetical protein